MILLQLWWAVLLLSNLGSTLDDDSTPKDSAELSSFYQAVAEARPELQELRSSFEGLREQYDHFHTLDDMLANFDKPHKVESTEEVKKEEQEWQESTKAWVRDIQASLEIPDHELGINIKENESKKQENKFHEDSKSADSLGKKESELQPSAVKGKVEDKLKNEHTATNLNPKATDGEFPRQRAKRSLDDYQQEQQPSQRVVAKRKAQLLDDFEDHNGNRVRFGDLGNGMLIPDAEDPRGKSMSFPGHELLTHYNELEAGHEEDSLAHIYDPTNLMVPLVQKRASAAPQAKPQQQQVQQQQQQQVQPQQQPQQQQQGNRGSQPSNFKASFNLNHFFNELQKMQNLQPSAAVQQPVQPAQPVQQPYRYQPQQNQAPTYQYQAPQMPMAPQVKTFGNQRYKQPRVNMGSNPAMDPNCVPVTPSPVADAQTPTPDNENCISADALKMNVAINANVCGDPKTKQFSGNGSISVQPYKELSPESTYDSHDVRFQKARLNQDERHIREAAPQVINERPSNEGKLKGEKKPGLNESHIKMPFVKWPGKKHNVAQKEKGCLNYINKCNRVRVKTEPRLDSFDRLISGRLSEDIVDAVFEAVGNDPDMERLLPVLERNRKCSHQQKNFYQIRNDKNENFLHQTEGMVRDTMAAISEIIEQQISRRACIPLRPDLVDFYELILQTAEEEQKVREKRQSSLRVLAEDFHDDMRLFDPSKINQKTRIVKKLLSQYQDLPLGEQLAAAGVHDELLLDLHFLRKMANTAERRKRDTQLNEVLRQESMDKLLEDHMNGEYSQRFIKLLKTAELFKESGEQQAKDLI